jgi:hypothetical protein
MRAPPSADKVDESDDNLEKIACCKAKAAFVILILAAFLVVPPDRLASRSL